MLCFLFLLFFKGAFVKAGDSETQKGLGEKKQQERA